MDVIKHNYEAWNINPTTLKIAFQGSQGSFSETALLNFFGRQVQRIHFDNFSYVYDALLSQECDFGILPIENTLIGTIHPSFDVLAQHRDLCVIADHTLRIEHFLIGMPNAKIEDITTVYSQSPGLAQCDMFLNQYMNWKRIPLGDTAAAVKFVSEQKNSSYVAIASERAAQIHGLEILKKNIETNQNNYTRFVVVVNQHHEMFKKWQVYMSQQQIPINVVLVIFSAVDEPGSLLRCLRVFEKNHINLHKIESRPIIGKPWEYLFTVEMDLAVNNEQDAIIQLREIAKEVHVVGAYHRLKTDMIFN